MKCVFSTHFSEETSNIKSKKTSHTHEKKRSGARGECIGNENDKSIDSPNSEFNTWGSYGNV